MSKKNGPKIAFTDISTIPSHHKERSSPSKTHHASSSSSSSQQRTPPPPSSNTHNSPHHSRPTVQEAIPEQVLHRSPTANLPLSSAEIEEQLKNIGQILAKKRKQYLRVAFLQFVRIVHIMALPKHSHKVYSVGPFTTVLIQMDHSVVFPTKCLIGRLLGTVVKGPLATYCTTALPATLFQCTSVME